MKPEKFKDIVNNPEHPIMQEVQNSLEGNDGDSCLCTNCGKNYIRGVLNFYNLCDPCFKEYDIEKMKQRWEWINNQIKK